MFSTIVFILEALIGFGVLIFVHELGHFLAAKWIGVRVDVFSLGFGPSLKKKWGETEYRLALCPIGGYVKMAGEEPEPGKPPQPGEFYSKTVGQRALVFVAGVVMNLLFGFIAFMLAYQGGVPVIPAAIGGVEAGSPAWKIGLKRGDRIAAIEGVSPPIDWEDLSTAVTLANPGEGVRLTVDRDGRVFEAVVYPEYDKDLGMPIAGIHQPDSLKLAAVPKSSLRGRKDRADTDLLFKAGLKPGDRITAVQVAGRPEPVAVATPEEFQFALGDCGGEPVRIFYRRDGAAAAQPVTVKPELVGPPRWLGIEFGSNRVFAVRPGSEADKAGLKEEDVILSVGGKPTRSRTEVTLALGKSEPGKAPVVVRRNLADITLQIPPIPKDEVESSIAFDPDLTANRAQPGYPAERAGIQPGDVILSANGVDVRNVFDLADIQDKAKGAAVELTWRRDGKTLSASLVPQRRWMIGLPLEPDQVIVKAPFLRSFRLGGRKAWQWTLHAYASLKSLVFAQVSIRNVNSFAAIGYMTYAAAKRGFSTFLYILGVLNINLGVMNLLPIPVLDGGHLLFAAIEKVRGRPVSEKVRAVASYVGLGLIIALLLVAFSNDIRLFLGI